MSKRAFMPLAPIPTVLSWQMPLEAMLQGKVSVIAPTAVEWMLTGDGENRHEKWGIPEDEKERLGE